MSIFIPEVLEHIYQYTDKNGNVILSDKPPSEASAKVKQLKGAGVYRSNRSGFDYPPYKDGKESLPTVTWEDKRTRDYARVYVVMYMTDWCGYCKQARQYTRSLGANLIEYNIEKDRSQ